MSTSSLRVLEKQFKIKDKNKFVCIIKRVILSIPKKIFELNQNYQIFFRHYSMVLLNHLCILFSYKNIDENIIYDTCIILLFRILRV